MATNNFPVFVQKPNVGWSGVMIAANTAVDGTGTVATAFTAGLNGGRIDRIRCKALGTNVATVLRVFINNGGATTTASNNSLVSELALPATTASPSAPITPDLALALGESVPPGYKVTLCIGTAGTDGWIFTCEGWDY